MLVVLVEIEGRANKEIQQVHTEGENWGGGGGGVCVCVFEAFGSWGVITTRSESGDY